MRWPQWPLGGPGALTQTVERTEQTEGARLLEERRRAWCSYKWDCLVDFLFELFIVRLVGRLLGLDLMPGDCCAGLSLGVVFAGRCPGSGWGLLCGKTRRPARLPALAGHAAQCPVAVAGAAGALVLGRRPGLSH